MTLTRKTSGPVEILSSDFPQEMPKLPETVRERFPEIAGWEEALSRWWMDVRTVMARRDDQLQSILTAKESTSNKGNPNGYASLGANGKVPPAQL